MSITVMTASPGTKCKTYQNATLNGRGTYNKTKWKETYKSLTVKDKCDSVTIWGSVSR